jgi:hypothetical protein
MIGLYSENAIFLWRFFKAPLKIPIFNGVFSKCH